MEDQTPAFPRTGFYSNDDTACNSDTKPQDGMTLRDYFAAKAMQALANNTAFDNAHLAVTAYTVADAMLEARKLG